ncbi:MAG: nitrous oxide reductase family maturation protein NosD [Bacteroidetes bacterium]|nr:nitrous oxide reductase family maturation protein NosD [Bacteroidota bacterium]
MRKKIFISACFFFACIAVSARVIKAGKHQAYPSIQQAIDASVPGDTVWVEAGVYREKNIVIKKSIFLSGDHYPVLDGEHHYEILSVKAPNVTIKGFKLMNSGISSLEDIAGLKIYNVSGVVVDSNILQNTFFGIYVQGGKNCIITNNQLKASSQTEQQSGNGIHCWKCDSMQITGNNISGHRDGIYFEFVTNSIIWRNISTHNIRYGLHFMFSNNDAYITNVFQNNGAGVSVMFTRGVKMFNNRFEDNWGDGAFGLLLKEISDSYVIGNKFIDNTSGIFMEGVSRVQIERNEFKKNGWGMKIQASCMDNKIAENNFLANTFDVGTNGSLVLNSFDGNYWDKYEGYDLNKDNRGDIPYHPVSLFSVIVEKNPPSMMLFRSFMTSLMDKAEKILPSLTPENLKDDFPYMKPLPL